MKIRRSVALILSITMGIGLLSGCKGEEEVREPTIETVIDCPKDNKTAMKSPVDVAVRYFYLINNGEYKTALKLLDLTDTYISADLLRTMYESVPNYTFSPSLVAVDASMSDDTIENGGTGVVTITYTDSSQSSFVDEQSYEEEPVWLNMTEPYVDEVIFSDVTEIQDMNEDGIINQADMEAEDNYVDEDDYTNDEDDENGEDIGVITETGFKTVQMKTELLANDKSGESVESVIESGSADEVMDTNNDKTVTAYSMYPIDITVKNKNGVFYVCLPESMKADGISLKLKVPDEMDAYLNGVKLSENLMDLDDNYIVTQLPMYSTATLTLKNKVDEPYNIELDLTKRMYFIYDYVMPTRNCKQGALEFASKAITQLYKSISEGESFNNSVFVNKYVSKDTSVVLFKDYYDNSILNGSLKGGTFSIIDLSLPSKDTNLDDYEDVGVSYNNFKIDNGNYLTLPIIVNISAKYSKKDDSYADEDLLRRQSVYGNLYLTKDNSEWKIWSFDSSLLLNSDYNDW